MTNFPSVFKDSENESKYMKAYDNVLSPLASAVRSDRHTNPFWQMHINVSGSQTAPPLVLLPGNFTSSTTWFYNVACLSQAYCVYTVDTLGDVGKSVPEHLPANRSDYAIWLNDTFTGLTINQAALGEYRMVGS